MSINLQLTCHMCTIGKYKYLGILQTSEILDSQIECWVYKYFSPGVLQVCLSTGPAPLGKHLCRVCKSSLESPTIITIIIISTHLFNLINSLKWPARICDLCTVRMQFDSIQLIHFMLSVYNVVNTDDIIPVRWRTQIKALMLFLNLFAASWLCPPFWNVCFNNVISLERILFFQWTAKLDYIFAKNVPVRKGIHH